MKLNPKIAIKATIDLIIFLMILAGSIIGLGVFFTIIGKEHFIDGAFGLLAMVLIAIIWFAFYMKNEMK